MDPPPETLSRGMGSPSPPPPARLFASLVRAYAPLVRRAARRAGVPERDLPDVTQSVFMKLHEAIGRGLDTSAPLAGWLLRTTCTLARDHLKLLRNARELISAEGDVETADGAPNPEEHMQTIDVHAVVDSILDELSPEHRLVLTMSDMGEMPMSEIAEALEIPVGTGYSRLHAARREFKRTWNERRAAGQASVLPFMLWEADDLVAAERSIPDAPPGFGDEVLRRLTAGLGLGIGPVAGFAAGAAAASAAKAGAMGAAKVGLILTRAQVAAGVVAAMVAGASLYAALGGALDASGPPAPRPSVVVTREQSAAVATATTASAPAASVALAPAPVEAKHDAQAPAPQAAEVSERTLLENARLALERDDPAAALALLARVKGPRFAAEREDLRRLARARQDGGR